MGTNCLAYALKNSNLSENWQAMSLKVIDKFI